MSPAIFGHGHLRLYLLSLLEERPRHGYELIQALGERFGGTYVPSAGTIYPRLAKLEAEGLVTKQSDGRKTVYEITDAGRAELAARRHELDGIESEVTDSVRRLADEVRASVDGAMRSLRAELAAAAQEVRTETSRATGSGAWTTGSGSSTGPAAGDAGFPGHDRTHTAPAGGPDADPGAERPPRPEAGGVGSRGEARARLAEAEEAVALFRQQIRSELRGQVARGELRRETVEMLRGGLADLQTAVLASLRGTPTSGDGSRDGDAGAAR